MAESKLNFTKGNLENIPLPEKKYTMYHDEKTPGLVLRVYPSGVKSFFLYRWTDGKPEYVSIGRYPALTPEQARRRAAELNAEIGAGKNPAEHKRNIRAEIPLSELFDRYMKHHAKPYKRSWRNDENLYNEHLKKWADRKISNISKKNVQLLHAEIMGEHPHQANRVRSLLSTMYSKGIEWGYEGTNPCTGVKKYKEQSRDRFIEQEELKPFFDAIMNEPKEILRDFWLLSLFTGARQGNMLEMAWKDIFLDRQEWRISRTKSGEAHSVPLVSYALEILARRREANTGGNPWVFPGTIPGEHLAPPIRAWARLMENAKLSDLRPHDLRRSLGSWMSICGVSLHIIGAALGHKGFTTTHVYARLQQAPVLQAMETAIRTMLRKGGVIPEEESIIEFKASV